MSLQISTAFISEFSDKIKLLSQQKDSKLKNPGAWRQRRYFN